MFEPVYSVSQISEILKALIEESFPQLTVEGELSNLNRSSTGHWFFSLKDEKAILKAVVWKNTPGIDFSRLADGTKVQARGRLSIYEKGGDYRLIVSGLQAVGLGEVLARLEALKQKLSAEGLFDPGRKRPLPALPQRIAVLTSPTGAALQDMLRKWQLRDVRAQIRLYPVAVQGQEAPGQLVRALELVNRHAWAEVVILARGGGSLEDLLAFSDEGVVRAVAASAIPVVSAVGHQVDWSLCDYAADHRSATPTAAAEEVSWGWGEAAERLGAARESLGRDLGQRLDRVRLLLDRWGPEHWEETWARVLQPRLLRLDDAKESLLGAWSERLRTLRRRLDKALTILEEADPQGLLDRGFSVVTDGQGRIVTEAGRLTRDQIVTIRLARGRASARVEDVHESL